MKMGGEYEWMKMMFPFKMSIETEMDTDKEKREKERERHTDKDRQADIDRDTQRGIYSCADGLKRISTDVETHKETDGQRLGRSLPCL